jgi:carbamoyltransferase
MISWGISGNSHDASLAVFQDSKLLFASHSERFSGIKNDPNLDRSLIDYAVSLYGKPKEVFWYERPLQKTLRQLYAGQGWKYEENNIKKYLKQYGISANIYYSEHHLSHAAAAFYTSGFKKSAVLIIDSIGEWDTTSIWSGIDGKLTKLWHRIYPNSIGLFYSSMTQRVGLKPQEDEYILMGMAAYGDPHKLKDRILNDFFRGDDLKVNLHRGCNWWAPELKSFQDLFDIAAATQSIYEDIFNDLLIKTKIVTGAENISLGGGCLLNCSANHIIKKYFNNIWIFPNPGDAGSSVGARLAYSEHKMSWKDNYLGYNISGRYPIKKALDHLLKNEIVGVANGRAEFGPRALGNRSLLADPRQKDTKEKVNHIKQRQQFRPFAPVILEELADDYFDLKGHSSRYMQYAVECLRPEEIPSVVHKDGTSRVQTVPPDNSGIRLLLEEWYAATGCPVLLNTSLNIKGKPIVNNENDAALFSKTYDVPVFTNQK